MKVFVGNLSPSVSEDDLKQAANPFGTVNSVSMAKDEAGNPKGFAFVEMSTSAEGQALIDGLQGKDLQGQALKLNEARPEKPQLRNQSGNATGVGFHQKNFAGGKGGKGTTSKGGYNIGTTGRNKV